MVPPSAEEPSANQGFHDLLIAEYEYVAETLLRNEDGGEKRASFFVALTGGTLAVLGIIFKEGARPLSGATHFVLAVALTVLLLFGSLTALRLAHRNKSTDGFIRRLNSIRKHFLTGPDDERVKSLGYNPYEPPDRATDATGPFRKGGWLETTFVMNALLAMALGATVADGLLAGYPVWIRLGADVAGAVAAGALIWRRQCAMRSKVTTPASDREVEAALIFANEDSAGALDTLAAERRCGGYLLAPLSDQAIADSYFDTERGDLARRRIALRVRVTGDERLLTLKGPGTRGEGLGEDRLEIEAPWSATALHRARDELARRAGIRLPPPAMPLRQDATEVLAACGLSPIQRRTTTRRRRSVSIGRGRAAIAELALDDVEYPATGGVVRLREVEIEARGAAGAAEVHDVARLLLERSRGALLAWPYSKLATGRAIDSLMRTSAFVTTLAGDASLTRKSLEMLEPELDATA